MKNKLLLSFLLLFIIGTTPLVFTSCEEDDEPVQGTANQNDPNNNDLNNTDELDIPDNQDSVVVTRISLDKSALTLAVGEEYTLTAIISSGNTADTIVIWTSSDNNKATVVAGKVTALAVGEVTITAQISNKTATCIVTVADPLIYDGGVVINGVKWATRNVDVAGTFTASSEVSGMLYQWNRKKAWNNTDYINTEDWDSSSSAAITWEKVNDPSPIGWRVPTSTEIDALLDTDKVTYEWATINGINGGKFTDKVTGNTLFIPAAGMRTDQPHSSNSHGYYWSSTPSANNAHYLLLFDLGGNKNSWSHSFGFGVRPVAE